MDAAWEAGRGSVCERGRGSQVAAHRCSASWKAAASLRRNGWEHVESSDCSERTLTTWFIRTSWRLRRTFKA